ncbi:MAG: response regulator [Bdellovibrionota bacterium]
MILEDDVDMMSLLKSMFVSDGFTVSCASSFPEARGLLRFASFDAVLLDLQINKDQSSELFPEIMERNPLTKIIIMTAHGSIDKAVNCLRKGASTFICKSHDPNALVQEVKDHLL